MLNYFKQRKYAAPDVSTQQRLERMEAYAAANLLQSRTTASNASLNTILLLCLIGLLLYLLFNNRPGCRFHYSS